MSRVIMKKIKRQILNRWPCFNVVDSTYFFHQSYKNIASGFCLEKTPTTLYVWKIMYPLFDPRTRLHLTYSDRIGHIDEGDDILESLSELLEEENIFEFYNVPTDRFIEYLTNREGGLSNSFVRRVVAIGLYLENKNQDALETLRPLLSCKAYSNQESFREVVDTMIYKLEQGEDLWPTINQWERANRELLESRTIQQ